MSGRRSFLRGGVVLTVGNTAGSVCSFARNIIIARIISVDDFGIASTFALTISLIEMASNIALDRLIIQAPDGEDERLQATAQFFQVIRGLLGSVVMFAVAGPVAALFEIPEVTWAFRVLAVVPFLRSLTHLDQFRMHRSMRFAASVWTDTTPLVVSTALAAPLAFWLDDYRVMLWAVLIQVSLYVLVSHIVAERRYAWAWDRALIARMLGFGWPLLINALLMFGIFQGDRAIVGASISMEALGLYSGAFGLLMMPSLIASRVLQSLLLPMLSAAADNAPKFNELSAFAIQLSTLAGIGFAAGTVWCGDNLLVVFYGEKYAPAASVVPWLACMQGMRIARAGQSIAAIAKADTRNPMYANIVRTLAIPLAIIGVACGAGVEWVAASGLIGEALAAVWSQRLLSRRIGLPSMPVIPAGCAAAAFGVVCFLVAREFAGVGSARPLDFVWGTLAGIASVSIQIGFSSSLRRHLSDRVSKGPGVIAARRPVDQPVGEPEVGPEATDVQER